MPPDRSTMVATSASSALLPRASSTNAFDARTVLGIPVLGMIPLMVTAADRRRAQWRQAAVSLGLVGVVGACATAIWLTFRI